MSYQFIAGAFTATWLSGATGSSAENIGVTRDGFHLRETFHEEVIVADIGGETPVDGIQLGVTTLITCDYLEYAKVNAAVNPIIYAASKAGLPFANVGQTMQSLSGTLVLTPVAGTPAATFWGSKVFTATKAIVANDLDTLLASKLRGGPITFKLFPDPASSPTVNATYVIA